MLYRADGLIGFEVRTTDGSSGTIRDLYFDDESWTIRYLVVDTGSWFSGKLVLISPQALSAIDRNSRSFSVNLTQQQIKDSPSVDSEKTVSRYHEELVSQYYGWAPYWVNPLGIYPLAGIYMYPPYPIGTPEGQERLSGSATRGLGDDALLAGDVDRSKDIHLRSFKEVNGSGLLATDGDIGEQDDLLIDDESWRITHLVVDCRQWWPGGQVLIDRGMIEDIRWIDHKIVIGMSVEEVKQAPAYDKEMEITDQYKSEISNYYQRIAAHKHSLRSLAKNDGAEQQNSL